MEIIGKLLREDYASDWLLHTNWINIEHLNTDTYLITNGKKCTHDREDLKCKNATSYKANSFKHFVFQQEFESRMFD